MPGIDCNHLHTSSRRASYSRRIWATQSWGPSSAATRAYWLMLDGQLVSWLWMSAIALAIDLGATAQPMRQPVIAKLLLAPLIVMVRSASSGRSVAMQVGRASP